MKYVTNSLTASDVRSETQNGRDYLAFPAILAREMVLNYPEWDRREYLPSDRIAESAPAWADAPVTVNHPPQRNGAADARVPDSYTTEVIGRVFRPNALDDGEKLRGEVWVDVDKARTLGGDHERIVDRLQSGETIQVSTGYATIDDSSEGGRHDGEEYDLEQGRLIPNHLALVTNDHRARCSPEDGCAAPRANAVADTDVDDSDTDADDVPDVDGRSMSDPAAVGRALVNTIQVALSGGDECDCSGACDDCQSRENNTADTDGADDPDGQSDSDSDASTDGQSVDDDDSDSGSDSDSDSDSDTMSDSTGLDSIAERTEFSVAELEEMSDSQIDTIESGIETDTQSDDGGDGSDGGDPADDGGSTDGDGSDAQDASVATDGGSTDDGGDGDDVEQKVNALVERVDQLESDKSDLERQNSELEKKVSGEYQRRQSLVDRMVTNTRAYDEEDREELQDMSLETLESTAQAMGVQADPSSGPSGEAAMGGVSTGSKERTNSEESTAPAPGRTNWEQQNAGDD